MSFLLRYFSSRRRWPTSSSRPRRLWWSCLCSLRCSVRWLMRWVSIATWTSGEPVSFSVRPCSVMICFLVAVSIDTQAPSKGRCAALPGKSSGALSIRGRSDGAPRIPAERVPDVIGAVSPAEQPAGRIDVTTHLSNQVVDGVEALLTADPRDEVHGNGHVVGLKVVAVEGIGLHGALHTVERRIRPDRDRRGQRHGVAGVEAGQVFRVHALR